MNTDAALRTRVDGRVKHGHDGKGELIPFIREPARKPASKRPSRRVRRAIYPAGTPMRGRQKKRAAEAALSLN